MKKKISTPKKVALAILGALTILTLVNLIEASVNKFKGDNHAFHVETHNDHFVHEDHDFNPDVDVDVDVSIDDLDFKVDIKENKIVVKKHKKAVSFDGKAEGEVMKERSFDVREGELISVEVGDADIMVRTHNEEEARVAILLDADNMRKAKEYFEDQNFEITYEGSAIYVRTNPVKKNYSWDISGGAEITIDLAIPSVFNADIRTSDGDVVMSALEGTVSLHTSDGDISTKSITGPSVSIRTSDGDIQTAVLEADNIHIRTSDGDISVEDLSADELLIRTSDGDIKGNTIIGQAAISTSDGDINLTSIEGDEINLRTSDGEVFVDQLVGKVSKIQTSDGSIVLRDVSGDITAKTSSGDLKVSLDKATNVFLRTGDGNIYVDAPSSYAATLYMKGENVQIDNGFSFSGEILENSADGTINGGGYKFEARTSDGEVIFREN